MDYLVSMKLMMMEKKKKNIYIYIYININEEKVEEIINSINSSTPCKTSTLETTSTALNE